jgi:hypothetical protein
VTRHPGRETGSESPYEAAVSIWLSPNAITVSMTVSAFSWLIRPSAAAPKMALVEW